MTLTGTVTFSVKFSAIADSHKSATSREARCTKRHSIILVWKLLGPYPKRKVDIAPGKFSRLLLRRVTEIGVIVNPIAPFAAKSPTTSPYVLSVGASAKNLVVYIQQISGKQKSSCQ